MSTELPKGFVEGPGGFVLPRPYAEKLFQLEGLVPTGTSEVMSASFEGPACDDCPFRIAAEGVRAFVLRNPDETYTEQMQRRKERQLRLEEAACDIAQEKCTGPNGRQCGNLPTYLAAKQLLTSEAPAVLSNKQSGYKLGFSPTPSDSKNNGKQ